MKEPKVVNFFSNGTSVVWDEDGKQMPELYTAWLRLFVNHLLDKGVKNIEDIKFVMPNRIVARVIVFTDGDNFNWYFEPKEEKNELRK